MLKIQAGLAKGRIIKSLPKAPHLRPILARIKKSLFDILMHQVPEARFLDLYAGTGAVGLEALSRLAQSAIFVERDKGCIRVLKENLKNLNFEDKGQIYPLDIPLGLGHLPKPFDVIFMGPPYKDLHKKPLRLVTPTLEAIHRFDLLSKRGLIVAQHHKKEEIELPTEEWDLYRQERYGDSILTFVKWK